MKILFIHFELEPDSFTFHQGIGSISAVLKGGGHQTWLLPVFSFDEALIGAALELRSPDILAISTTERTSRLTRAIIEYASSRMPRLVTVIGGVHPTISPQSFYNIPGLKAICIGEGEYPMLELADAMQKGQDFHHIQNWIFLDGGVPQINPVRPLIQDLDSLPWADRELFEYQRAISSSRKGKASFMIGRGCPYPCVYCANPALRKVTAHKQKSSYTRQRSVGNVIDEIKHTLSSYQNIRFLNFQDDNIAPYDDHYNIDYEWFDEFCKRYKSEVGLPYCCNCRCDFMNDDVAVKLKESGCYEIRMAIESGDYELRRKLARDISEDAIINAFRAARAAGLKTTALNMLNVPGETEETLRKTFDLNLLVSPDRVRATIFDVREGTPIHKRLSAAGQIGLYTKNRTCSSIFIGKDVLTDEQEKSSDGVLHFVNHPDLKFETVLEYHQLFLNTFNKNKVWNVFAD
jgi:anaerobic magnesium-protoporphyrin IX monomethyl ester cyclase